MANEPVTKWNTEFYNPVPPVPVKPPKPRAQHVEEMYQAVYDAILSGCNGPIQIRVKTNLTIWQVAESQRKLAKAGYLTLVGHPARLRYIVKNPDIKTVVV